MDSTSDRGGPATNVTFLQPHVFISSSFPTLSSNQYAEYFCLLPSTSFFSLEILRADNISTVYTLYVLEIQRNFPALLELNRNFSTGH